MRVVIIEPDSRLREALGARVRESLRRARLKRADVFEGDFDLLIAQSSREVPTIAFFGPGCYSAIEDYVTRFRSLYPKVPVAVVVDNAIYVEEAIELRRVLAARIIPIADVAQIAQFLIDCSGQAGDSALAVGQGVIAVAQLKGGVGATTIAVSLAECWAEHDLKVAVVELDDVNPQLTAWAGVPAHQQKLLAELLHQGAVPYHRVSEAVTPIKSGGGRIAVVGTPERYIESFHYKADVLENAASSADFVRSLVQSLQQEFDVVVLDLGRSWGVATFAALTVSQHVVLVSESAPGSLECSLRNLYRLSRESEDINEFDFTKWHFLLNARTPHALDRTAALEKIREADLFPENVPLALVPYSASGSRWPLSDRGFYSLAERALQTTLTQFARTLVPFRIEQKSGTVMEYFNRFYS